MDWLDEQIDRALYGEPSSFGPGWRATRRADGVIEHRPVIARRLTEEVEAAQRRLTPELALRVAAAVPQRRRLFGRAPDPRSFPMP